MLDIVVMNVGISQQLFHARVLSDSLSILYGQEHPRGGGVGLSEPRIAQCLLVFAMGRLLQARWDDSSDTLGQGYFKEALKRIPSRDRSPARAWDPGNRAHGSLRPLPAGFRPQGGGLLICELVCASHLPGTGRYMRRRRVLLTL